MSSLPPPHDSSSASSLPSDEARSRDGRSDRRSHEGSLGQSDGDGVRWQIAETLVDQTEQAAKRYWASGKIGDDHQFARDLVEQLRQFSGAASVSLSLHGESRSVIAKSGISLARLTEQSAEEGASADGSTDRSIVPRWVDDPHECRFVIQRPLIEVNAVELSLRFDHSVELNDRSLIAETSVAMIDLAVPVVLRMQLRLANRINAVNQDQTQLAEAFFGGVTVEQTYRGIAQTLAQLIAVDRVNVVEHQGSRSRFVATSVPSDIDHRTGTHHMLTSAASMPDGPARQNAWDEYRDTCGAAMIECVDIKDEDSERIATVVMESFPGPRGKTADSGLAVDQDQLSTADRFASWHSITTRAIRVAANRGRSGPASLGQRIRGVGLRSWCLLGFVAVTILAVLWMVEVPLKLSVPGRMVAAEQATVYSPTDGIVVAVHVDAGQAVDKHTPLLTLRSPELDLLETSLKSRLATTRTKIQSLRSYQRDADGRRSSADAEVLKQEFRGLERQLKLVQAQQEELILRSSIAGIVDRWDTRETLLGQAVVIGHPLLSLRDAESGWRVELEVPDQNIGYLAVGETDRLSCQYRLRSSPTQSRDAVIEELASGTHINSTGESVVMASFHVPTDTAIPFRHGASVTATINCGQRRAGFVVFRRLIQWYREQIWF